MPAGHFPIRIVEAPYMSTEKLQGRYGSRWIATGGALDAKLNVWVAAPRAIGIAKVMTRKIWQQGSNSTVGTYQGPFRGVRVLVTKKRRC